MISIAPSVLARDNKSFTDRIHALAPHIQLAQLDVIDNSLIAGESIADPRLIESLNTTLNFEVHLMVDLQKYAIAQWNRPWVESIIVHCESSGTHDALALILSWGKKAFAAINPDTPVEFLSKVVGKCSGVMFMTVEPGANGSPFRHDVVEHIALFHGAHPEVQIEVDGGVTPTSIKQLMNAGASRFAVGSFIDNDHVAERLQQLHDAVKA